MTHSPEVIAEGLNLASQGCSATEVSWRIGVPRPTVRDWLSGHVPRIALGRGSACQGCGGDHDLTTLPRSYPYLLGIYLGDGCLSAHRRRVFKLRISLDARYPEIADECVRAVGQHAPRNTVRRVDRGTWWEIFAYSKTWPCLFPQHGAGRKHERSIVLVEWQSRRVAERPDLLLRGLIQSDGCRFLNSGRCGWSHPRYSFTNHSEGIRKIFSDACDSLGLHWTRSGEHTLYVSRKHDVALLDLLVGPKR